MARSHYRTSVVLIITTTSAGIDHYVHMYWNIPSFLSVKAESGGKIAKR